MSKESENYLDQLLNAVQGGETQPTQEGSDKKRSRKEKNKNKKSQPFFIEEFERELDASDADSFLSEFERELNGELDLDVEEDKAEQLLSGLSNAMQQAGTQLNKTEAMAEQSAPGDAQAAGSVEVGESVKAAESIEDVGSVEEEEDIEDTEFFENIESFDGVDHVENTENAESEKSTEGMNGEEDILSMLDGLGEEDSDLADIGDMLKADENNERLDDTGISTEDLTNSLSDLGFDVNPEDEEELSELKDVSGDSDGNADAKENSKKGLFSKLKSLLFGPDEEEAEVIKKEETPVEAADISDENLDILKALESGDDSSKEDTKKDKKAAKEAKKKEAAALKEAKAKEKEAAKKAKAAAKAAKPKKPKKPKEIDRTPPLPKLPVFLIFVMAASFGFIVIYSGTGIHYRLTLGDAENAYSMGNYSEAYNEIAGMKFNEKDQNFADKVVILGSMQQLIDSYEVLLNADHVELAVDSLVRVLGHYDANIEKAGELGFTSEITALEGIAENILTEEYGITYDQAMHLYALRSRVKYSRELHILLKEAGKI